MSILKPAKEVMKTARPLRSSLLFLSLFLGYWLAGFSWVDAACKALPMLLIALAGFCINDIFDQEQDRINHPDRTLAKYPALSKHVTTTYVLLFAGSVFTIALQDSSTDKFLWALFFILLSNYNFFKRSFPACKNVYISLAAALPAALLDSAYDGAFSAPILYCPFILAVFARELACDIPDIEGDGKTLANSFGPERSWYIATSIYVLAIMLTAIQAESLIGVVSALVGAASLALYVCAKVVFGWSEKTLIVFSGPTVVAPVVLLIS